MVPRHETGWSHVVGPERACWLTSIGQERGSVAPSTPRRRVVAFHRGGVPSDCRSATRRLLRRRSARRAKRRATSFASHRRADAGAPRARQEPRRGRVIPSRVPPGDEWRPLQVRWNGHGASVERPATAPRAGRDVRVGSAPFLWSAAAQVGTACVGHGGRHSPPAPSTALAIRRWRRHRSLVTSSSRRKTTLFLPSSLVAALTGMTQRQLRYLVTMDVVQPTGRRTGGRGDESLYTPDDLLPLVLIRRVRSACGSRVRIARLRDVARALEEGPSGSARYLIMDQGGCRTEARFPVDALRQTGAAVIVDLDALAEECGAIAEEWAAALRRSKTTDVLS
jgi:DNA-binding transcriptional MerR regulator